MTVFSVGSPVLAADNATNSPSQTATFPTGSSPLAGHLMVAVVTAYGTTTATLGTPPSGWALQNSVTAGSNTVTGYYLKTATGSDSAPVFTGTLTGTAADASFGVVVYDLGDSSGNTPAWATDGTSTGTSGTITATTSNDVPSAGCVAIGATICSQGTTAATTTWTTPSGWNQVITATASARSQPAHYITLPAPAPVSTLAVTYTHSRTSTEQSAIVAVLAPPPPPLPVSQPAGSRGSWLRAGSIQASLIIPVAAAVTLAPLYPLPGPVHAKLPSPVLHGRVYQRPGAWSGTGPPVYPQQGPSLNRDRTLPPASRSGRVHHRTGTYSGTGPASLPLTRPARARTLAVFSKGRALSTPPYVAPAIPVTPAQVYPLRAPVRAKLPPPQVRGQSRGLRGTVSGTGPAARLLQQPAGVRLAVFRTGHFQARQGTTGPPAAPPLSGPVQARLPAPSQRGHGGRTSGARAGQGPVIAIPALRALPVRARQPLPVVHGRAMAIAPVRYSGLGTPVPPLPGAVGVTVYAVRTGHTQSGPGLSASAGPPVTPLHQPARARVPVVFSKGRRVVTAPAYVVTVAVTPPVPLTRPFRAQPPFPVLHGRAESRSGTFSGLGPPAAPLRAPFRSRIPAVFSRGRALRTPPYVAPAPPVYAPLSPHTSPVTAKLPLPVVHGRAATMAALAVPAFVTPVLYPLTGPVGLGRRAPGPARYGRALSTPQYVPPAAPALAPLAALHAPVAPGPAFPVLHGRTRSARGTYSGTGPALTPLSGPARAKLPVPVLRGRSANLPGAYSGTGPQLRPLTRPARSPLPATFSRGRVIRTPAYVAPYTAPPLVPMGQPAGLGRRAPGPVLHGRVIRHAGISSGTGPAVTPLTGPVISRRPQPTRYGRGSGSRGLYSNVGPKPKPPAGPVQARRPLPPRGHGGTSPGVYASSGPSPFPLHTPVRARQPLPPRGTWQALAGVYSPIPPPPAVPPPLGILYLTPATISQAGPQAAATVSGTGSLLVISPDQNAAVTISPVEEGIAPVQAGPPRAADLSSPEPVTLLPDLPG